MGTDVKNKGFTLKRALDLFIDNAIYFVLIILFVVIVIMDSSFLKFETFLNILSQSSTRVILALGVGGIIVSKGTDLSLGRLVGLAAVLSGSLLQAPDYAYKVFPNLPEIHWIFPLILSVIVIAIFSGFTGFVVSKLNVDPFIATLGMSIIVYGVTSLYFDRPPRGASPIGTFNEGFKALANEGIQIGGFTIKWLLIIAIIVTAAVWLVWNKTKFGKNMFAIGGNKEAARVSGVNVSFYLIMIYVFAGALYGLGGTLEAARVGSVTNNTGYMYELDAISACIVGGLSFNGGIGKISGIVVGVLIFQVISYGLNYTGIPPYVQYIVKGAIIILAVAIDSRKNAVKS